MPLPCSILLLRGARVRIPSEQRAQYAIPQATFVCEYAGEIVGSAEAADRRERYGHANGNYIMALIETATTALGAARPGPRLLPSQTFHRAFPSLPSNLLARSRTLSRGRRAHAPAHAHRPDAPRQRRPLHQPLVRPKSRDGTHARAVPCMHACCRFSNSFWDPREQRRPRALHAAASNPNRHAARTAAASRLRL